MKHLIDSKRLYRSTGSVEPNYILLTAGVVVLLIPLVFSVWAAESYEKVEFHLRVITALGGGLVGASLPGLLNVKLPFAQAGGALGVFLLIFAVNPPQTAFNTFTLDTPQPASVSELSEIGDRSLEPEDFSVGASDASDILASGTDSVIDGDVIAADSITASTKSAWKQVMAISWVKPSDWLGRKYHLKIDDGIYLWPTELDGSSNRATIIVNNSKDSRDSDVMYLENEKLRVGEEVEFDANGKTYSLSLISIRNAGKRPTLAGYFQADVQTPQNE